MELYTFLLLLLSWQQLGSAIPVNAPLPKRNVHAVKRTTTPGGSQIDWVPLESQTSNGQIAQEPPAPPSVNGLAVSSNDPQKPKPELQQPGAEVGPKGTVPVLVASNATLQMQRSKGPPVRPGQGVSKRQDSGIHWYASTAQDVNNLGGSAAFSIYDAYTTPNDFSLLQTAVIAYNVPTSGGTTMQTVECGWINYPAQIAAPHLFTFYTTNGYTTDADNQGGWNRDVAGWVQTDTTIFPGTSFTPLATIGGTQYEIKIQVYLYEGNWWIYVLDRYIGYYPASLYSAASTSASASLAGGSNAINFYGEIYNSENGETTTDMGSGEFASTGYGESAYIRQIVYTNTNGDDVGYDGTAGEVVSDSSRYSLQTEFQNTANGWGSYMFLGGPGAGGVVGG